MTELLNIPTINDNYRDFISLFNIWNNYKDSNKIVLDFSNCKFIRHNAVAFLGGLAYHIKSKGGTISVNHFSLKSDIATNLAQNGFLGALEDMDISWEGNSIPYRHDLLQNPDSIREYLENKWIGSGWIHASELLTEAIVGTVWELYENAFEHSESKTGVFTCGQYYPKLNELAISIIDFGIGIPQSVNKYCIENPDVSLLTSSRIETAFQSGFSTKIKDARGLGLDLLRDFIQLNGGQMDIYSNNEHALISSKHNIYEQKEFIFDGTAINIKLKCDEAYYHILTEATEEPVF